MLNYYLIPESASLPLAYWQTMSLPEQTAFVIDEHKKLTGFINASCFPPFSQKSATLKAGDICNRKLLKAHSREEATFIAAEYPYVPIVPLAREDEFPIGVFRRWQLFFRDEYLRAVRTSDPVLMPYPQYAVVIWRAANVAISTGIKKFSVIEFGVAEGSGLIACELIASEIARLFNIEIIVYGFDGGSGLPKLSDWRDCPQCWKHGEFPMNVENLRNRLQLAHLVLGPLQETCPAFQPEAPIGAMLVDVDFYSSTLPVIAMLEGKASHFLPIVNMYFDDIGGSLEFQGETLAIKEFNQRNALRKISPELESFGEFNFKGRRYGFSKLKACMLYDHQNFTELGFKSKIMHDFWR